IPRVWILCVQHYHWRDHIHEMTDGKLFCDDDAGRSYDATEERVTRETIQEFADKQKQCQHETVRRFAADTEGPIGGPHRPQHGTRYAWTCDECFGVLTVHDDHPCQPLL